MKNETELLFHMWLFHTQKTEEDGNKVSPPSQFMPFLFLIYKNYYFVVNNLSVSMNKA